MAVVISDNAVEVRTKFNLTARAESVKLARWITRHTCELWRLGLIPELIDDAQTVMSELATNAIKFAHEDPQHRATIEIGMQRSGNELTIFVWDGSPRRPVLQPPDFKNQTGRGLQVIAELFDEWGCSPDEDGIGKSVWAVKKLPPVRRLPEIGTG